VRHPLAHGFSWEGPKMLRKTKSTTIESIRGSNLHRSVVVLTNIVYCSHSSTTRSFHLTRTSTAAADRKQTCQKDCIPGFPSSGGCLPSVQGFLPDHHAFMQVGQYPEEQLEPHQTYRKSGSSPWLVVASNNLFHDWNLDARLPSGPRDLALLFLRS
jgi:hypothetical protein